MTEFPAHSGRPIREIEVWWEEDGEIMYDKDYAFFPTEDERHPVTTQVDHPGKIVMYWVEPQFARKGRGSLAAAARQSLLFQRQSLDIVKDRLGFAPPVLDQGFTDWAKVTYRGEDGQIRWARFLLEIGDVPHA